MLKNDMRTALPMAAMDDIPDAKPDAKSITGLVKQSGRIVGYQLSDGSTVTKENGIAMAKNGDIKGVGIAVNTLKYDDRFLYVNLSSYFLSFCI